MYSVLIQNEKTMASFRDYYPIFMDAIKEGRIGVCQWMEAGTTIETAVPELYSMTNDKENWRAVIVRVEDDSPMQAHPTVPENPYDFIENADADAFVKESEVPLVRLTQMLGGVPAPQTHFVCEQIQEENKAPRMIYRPVVNQAEEILYKELSEKYHFDGKAPTEIILVSLRTRQERRAERVRSAWHLHKEIESSSFWKRNGYPSSCRFAFCEMQRQGPVQRTADLFRVWITVMMLATNEVDPSTLQAYHLHKVGVEFDSAVMTQTIQRVAGRTISASRYITKSIQRELEQKLSQETILPDYRLEAPVVLKLPQRKEIIVNTAKFKLTSQTVNSDMNAWREMENSAQSGIGVIATCTERALDQTAERIRKYCAFSESEVFPLDEYQEEDFNRELDQLYDDVFAIRSQIPSEESEDVHRLVELGKDVKEKLLMRITSRNAMLAAVLVAVFLALACLPALFFHGAQGWGSLGLLLGVVVAGAAVMALAELAVLLVHRTVLRNKVNRFNSCVNEILTRTAENASMFSRYMSGIASYTRGSTFLSLLSRKRFLRDEAQFYKQNHVAALGTFLAVLKSWATAFHLNVNFEATELDEELLVEAEVPPAMNPLYTFETDAAYEIPVNTSGDTAISPFDFISKLTIMREELYDDAK